MDPKIKKMLNRGGLIAVGIGIVAIVIGGGDTGAALDIAGTVASIAGAIVILIREILD